MHRYHIIFFINKFLLCNDTWRTSPHRGSAHGDAIPCHSRRVHRGDICSHRKRVSLPWCAASKVRPDPSVGARRRLKQRWLRCYGASLTDTACNKPSCPAWRRSSRRTRAADTAPAGISPPAWQPARQMDFRCKLRTREVTRLFALGRAKVCVCNAHTLSRFSLSYPILIIISTLRERERKTV